MKCTLTIWDTETEKQKHCLQRTASVDTSGYRFCEVQCLRCSAMLSRVAWGWVLRSESKPCTNACTIKLCCSSKHNERRQWTRETIPKHTQPGGCKRTNKNKYQLCSFADISDKKYSKNTAHTRSLCNATLQLHSPSVLMLPTATSRSQQPPNRLRPSSADFLRNIQEQFTCVRKALSH